MAVEARGAEEQPPIPGRWRVALWTGLLLLALYGLTTGGQTFISDGEITLLTAVRIVDYRVITLPEEMAVFPQVVRGQGGFLFSRYGIGQSAAAAPLYWFGRAVLGQLPGAVGVNVGRFLALLLPALATAAGAAALCAWASRIYQDLRLGVALALLYGAGTLAWPYSRFFFTEPLFTSCLVLGALGIAEDRPMLAGLALGYAVATRVAGATLLPAFFCYAWLLGQRWRRLLWLCAGMLPCAALVLLHNWLRFRVLSEQGYQDMGFTGNLLEGLRGLLLSPGKSIFLYVPLLLALPWAALPFARRHRPEAVLVALVALVTLLQGALWWIWWGGWGWGPRFLVPAIPFLVLPLGVLLQRAGRWRGLILYVLLPLSLAVNLLGILVDFNGYLADSIGTDLLRENQLYYDPLRSPIVGHLERLDPARIPIVSLDLARPEIGLPPLAALLYPVALLLLWLAMALRLSRALREPRAVV